MKRFVGSFTFLISFFFLLTLYSPVYAEWHFQDSGVTVTLNDVCFVDEMHGWAVGNSSTIIKTSNGGETWVKQDCPVDNLNIRKVYFVNDEVGYYIGDTYIDKTTPNPTGSLFASRDGGKTWVKKHDIDKFNLKYLLDVYFATPEIGWMTNLSSSNFSGNRDGGIFYTKDGGDTWEVQLVLPSSLSSYSLDFLDKNIGWAICGGFTDLSDPTFVYHTINGGEEWTEISSINGPKRILDAVFPNTIWLCNSELAISTNGGLSWKKYYSQEYYYTKDVHAIDGQRAFVLNRNISIGSEILFASDGVKTLKVILDYSFTVSGYP